MKKVLEVIEKEIAKKSEKIASALKAKEAIDINNQASFNDFMNSVKGLDSVYSELQQLNKTRDFINSLSNEPSVNLNKTGKRGRPKKNS